MIAVPDFFKNSYEYMMERVYNLKKCEIIEEHISAGGKKIPVVQFGIPNNHQRTANYSSALGANDISCFKKNEKPCIMIIGGTHGGEIEGISAILNLFSLLENKTDLMGREHSDLLKMMEKSHIIFVPCINPDGRCRVPFEGVAGMELSKFRYFAQGAWKDGTLCGWPGCKKEHPMKNVSYLGSYFNDNGINLMHDDFFNPMATETRVLINLATTFAPDVIVNLHGAANMGYGMYAPGYAAEKDRRIVRELEQALCISFRKNGFRFIETGCFSGEAEFNLTTALYLACGGISITWESYQGVVGSGEEMPVQTVYQDILDAHLLMFNEIFKLANNIVKGDA